MISSDTPSPVGVVVAMDLEARHLLDLADELGLHPSPQRVVHRFRIGAQHGLLVQSGIGLVNAAAATEWLLTLHAPAVVLNFGCAGAHVPDLLPGDLVIGRQVVQHSALHILPDGTERYKGFHALSGQTFIQAPEIPCDPALVQAAEAVVGEEPPAPWPTTLSWPAPVPRRQPVVRTGTIASADVWTQHRPRLDLLHQRHGSLCEDMEAAAIGQVAQSHGAPFLTVKDISNNEHHQASDLETFSDFPDDEVGRRAAAVIAGLIRRLELAGA